ncbi:hypothetical protein AAG570_009572 [Ranatra chinensis]|uniref:Uncharacterized protein n=1 Tax=Ranatra chinensis TaxID=642074 RepID=A0ABD0YPI5_9HEMI
MEDGRLQAMNKYYSMAIAMSLSFALMYGTYALGFWYGSTLFLKQEAAPGDICTVFFSVLVAAFSIGHSLPVLAEVANAVGASSVVFSIISLEPQIDVYSDEGEKPSKLEGKIFFKDVKFTYPARSDVEVLKGLNLTINAGSVVALVGQSGAGKSTLVGLLMRFYDPTSGEILIDGKNMKDFNLNWLRCQIGVVSQEPVLFGVSIADNIKFGNRDASHEEMVNAAKLANAHEFITNFPNGYETPAGDRGMQLSGGQKQRIAIARALIRDPKILLLDEATSALDNESEKVVQEALDKARKGRTSIIVAHRLSTIRDADMIVVIKNGKVIERGTHQQLKNLQGHYYNLIKKQEEQEE